MGRVTPYSSVVGKSDCPAEAIIVLTNLPAKAPPNAPAAPHAATVRARGPSVSTLVPVRPADPSLILTALSPLR